MRKSFKRLALIAIIVLTLAAMVVPASAYYYENGSPEDGTMYSMSSLPARCGSSC